MLTCTRDIVSPCPICGLRLKIRPTHLGQQMKCRHCRGQFFVSRRSVSVDASQSASPPLAHNASPDSPELFCVCVPEEAVPSSQHMTAVLRIHLSAVHLAHPRRASESICETSSDSISQHANDAPAVLLVEHRDEVYARLAADLADADLEVTRATTAFQALAVYARRPYDLVVANLDLPDQSGWLLAAKLHFIHASVNIWLYEPRKTPCHVSMAKFLRVDAILSMVETCSACPIRFSTVSQQTPSPSIARLQVPPSKATALRPHSG